MKEYQAAYIDAYRSGTELGTWLEMRPIVAQVNNTLFVHGGISGYGSALLREDGVDGVNRKFASMAHEQSLRGFIEETQRGKNVYDMLDKKLYLLPMVALSARKKWTNAKDKSSS